MKYEFKNRSGETLSGQLELPKSPPHAFAIFAHCFTCSKDFIAASTISRALTKHGIAVLRFDFTGLGNSEGDFSNTNFSSNVADLFAAYESLSKTHTTPSLIIGHSLGGAAVLKAAPKLEGVKAVVTIAAPSATEHVTHLFKDNEEKINTEGLAAVNLAGRTFTIKKQFIDDIKESEVLSGLNSMGKALLILHSPTDNTVSIEHATNIFVASKHPKSFVSLDQADHLLMNRNDAKYAATVIGSWVQKYIADPTPDKTKREEVAKGEVVVKSRPHFKFTQDVISSNHSLIADEPISYEGTDLGMSPYELLLSSLGACTSMTIGMYAKRKGYKLNDVKVTLRHEKIHATDCLDCETKNQKVDHIEKQIELFGDFTKEEHQKMLEIAEKCPVNRTLLSDVSITKK